MNRGWRKSTHSNGNAQCVEVAWNPEGVWLRDSKHTDGPTLRFSRSEWAAFVAGVKDGEFDPPPARTTPVARHGAARPA